MKDSAIVRVCLYILLIMVLVGVLLVGLFGVRWRSDGERGMESTNAPEQIIGEATVRELLKLRASPTVEATELGVLLEGERVKIGNFADVQDVRWYYILGDNPGWVQAEYIEIDQTDGQNLSSTETNAVAVTEDETEPTDTEATE